MDGRDGEARAGLNLVAWEVQPMGQIGRRKPKVRPRDEYGAVPFDGGDISVETLHAYARSSRGSARGEHDHEYG